MSSFDSIGGYFQLEKGDVLPPHFDNILLNSGRSCFEYVLKACKPTRVYMPLYTCDVMYTILDQLKIPFTTYRVNQQLEIAQKLTLKNGEMLLYTNYFGLKDGYSRMLEEEYGQKLILDCAQAFYFESKKYESSIMYSPRKFFGLPDGGILQTSKLLHEDIPVDTESHLRCNHLLKSIDLGIEAAYDNFKSNDESIDNQPLKIMSHLTKRMMSNIDYDKVQKKRKQNFKYLHDKLKEINKLNIEVDDIQCPLVYPLLQDDKLLKQKLIKNKIFVATYWPNIREQVRSNDIEYKLSDMLLALPIDQRYNETDMKKIINLIGDSGL